MSTVYDQPMTLPAAIIGVVNALLALLSTFGYSISQQGQTAIILFVNALLVLGAVIYDSWRGRRPTTPPAASS